MSKLNEDIIIRYLENRCSEEDFVLINEWMKESDENAGELFRMEEIYQLGKFPFEEENLVVRAERRLGRRLEQENQKRQEVFKLKSVLRYAAAIVGVMVLAAGLAYWFRNKAEELVVASAAHGQVREMLLPDGTKVWLNQSSVLKYPRAFEGKERHVYLDGEAYFEVAKNKDLPFVVKANGIDVKAIGTAFNVSAYMEDSQLTTTLFNGKVAVQPTLTKQEVLLEPNQVAVYDKSRNKIEVVPYDKKLFAQWRGGFLSFEMMYLQDITKLLERNYNVVFRYENQGIKKLRFSGSFRNNEDLSEILNVIKTNTGIRYQILKDTIVIK